MAPQFPPIKIMLEHIKYAPDMLLNYCVVEGKGEELSELAHTLQFEIIPYLQSLIRRE